MACVNCFFSSEHQKELKLSCFGTSRFENRLKSYKQKYLLEIVKLISVRDCSCPKRTDKDLYFQWTDDFLEFVKYNTANISYIFDALFDIYNLYIIKSPKHAADKLWTLINDLNLIGYSETAMDYCQLLFRGREKTKVLDPTDPLSYFHIPFNSRYFVGNQRFSISGQPMLYFGNSILNIEKELGKPLSDLSIAAFLPNYSIFYGTKINNIKNIVYNTLVKSLPVLFNSGSKLHFNDPHISPNCNTITNFIQRSILSEILSFPVQNKNNFVEEYVLPQLFTSLLVEYDFKGLLFPSTKNYDDLQDYHIYSDFDINTVIFTNYNSSYDYDMDLLNSFHSFLLDGSEKYLYQGKDIIDMFDEASEKNKKSTLNNNDFMLPLVSTKLYIEYMDTAKLNGISYFETEEGKMELEFFAKLSKKMLTLIH